MLSRYFIRLAHHLKHQIKSTHFGLKNKRIKKTILISLASVVVVFSLVVFLISPLAKYFLEKYDEDFLGRELTMDWAYVNPFTGFVYLRNIKIYEAKKDTLFIAAHHMSGRISIFKLFSRTIEISKLTLDQPKIKFIQRKRIFNIDDLIRKFTPDKLNPSRSSWSVAFIGARIINGEFHFTDKIIPIHYFIKQVNLEGFGKLDAGDTIATHVEFLAGIGSGAVKGDFTFNTESLDYRYTVKVSDYDLDIIRQYIWELINYGMFRAHLNANMSGKGNFSSETNISSHGRIGIRDFHLGKTVAIDYVAFDRLVMVIDELNPEKRKYLFDSAVLINPYLNYEIYDSLNNAERLFGKSGSNISDITKQTGRFNLVIEIARYLKTLSSNFFKSDYRINRLEIKNGKFIFNDYSTSEKFTIEAAPLSLVANAVNKHNPRVEVAIKTAIEPYGTGSVRLSINPRDSGDFNMNFRFEDLPVSVFNPYLVTHTSFPLDRGMLELNGEWVVRKGVIQSKNHLVVIDPRISTRIKNKNIKWLPMPLIMALVREEGNVIDYDIPITGNLKNPKFHFRDVLFDLVKNIFIKPPTLAYRSTIKNLESEIEKTLRFTWAMHQHVINKHQDKFIKKIADFLRSHQDASLLVSEVTYAEREKEYILFFETKKKYFMLVNHKESKSFTKKDSMAVEAMSVKDPAMVRHISRHTSDTVLFTIQDKCLNFVGHQILQDRLNELMSQRSKAFLSYFKSNGTESQIKFVDHKNEIPFNGFSFFKLTYKDEIPGFLQNDYQKMVDLNNEGIRKKYRHYRNAETLE